MGVPAEGAHPGASVPLARLNIPECLQGLPPATFPCSEQQRVNTARGFAVNYLVLPLDEPTALLDAAIRRVVVVLIKGV